MSDEIVEKTMDELKEEAMALDLKFKGNISRTNLQTMIEEYYDAEMQDSKVTLLPVEKIVNAVVNSSVKVDKKAKLRNRIAEEKEKAFKLRKVVLTLNDKRESDVTTAVYIGFENQFFGKDRIVPLDIPVELEECLIEIARSTKITLHRDQIVNGRRTGNKVPIATNKYNIQIVE